MKQLPTSILTGTLIFAGLTCPWTHATPSDDAPLRKAVECHPRSGLPNFRAKVESGKTVRIAYLGGSITAAPGWRVQSREWFQREYPKARFDEIHAAIGGTGSDLGVFRLGHDVLQHEPDLLFVEFAVNDGATPTERIHKAMEGIVRQTWKANPATDICFVYTVSLRVMPDLRAGRMQPAASAMEEVAGHYGIPSIHFGVQVAALEKSGELVFKAPKPGNPSKARPMVFSTDGVHPHNETGHRLYTEAIARSWPAIRDAGDKPVPHPIPKPLRADNWEAAKQVPITAAMRKGSWKPLPGDHALARRFRRNMPVLYQALEAGASLEFHFRGTTASVFDLMGPDGGRLEIQVDGQAPVSHNRFDGYCSYHRMSKVPLLTEAKEDLHRVRITLTDARLDKRKILHEQRRGDFDANPAKYEDHAWYAASLLIIGDIEPDP
jgi:lysophospholipase L1-like esterase